MKSGWKETEFWITIAIVAIGGGIAYLAFTIPGTGITGHITAVIGVILAFVKAHMYSIKRTELKLQEIYKDLNNLNNPPTPTPPPIIPPLPYPTPAPTPTPPKTPDTPTISFPVPENGSDSVELEIKYKYNVIKKRKLKIPSPETSLSNTLDKI